MMKSLEAPLSLDALLKLLMALILLSVLVALLQSDSTVGVISRAVNNFAILPLLLIADLGSGLEMILTSGRTKFIFSIIQETALGIVGRISKTIQYANVSVRTHKVLSAVYRSPPQFVDAARLIAGRIERVFVIVQALLFIACDAAIDYIRDVRTGRSISDDVLSICNFALRSSICVLTLLYIVSRSLGNLMHTLMIKLNTHFKKSAAYNSFLNFLLSISDVVSNKLHSFWTSVCNGLAQKFEVSLDFVFGDGQAMRSVSPDLTNQSPSRMLSASRDVGPVSNSNYQSPWKGRLRARTSGVQG